MPGRLDGKVAVVTGAGRGNGRAIARVFAREGAAVLVVDKDAGVAQATVDAITGAGGTASAFTADVSKAADMEAMARTAIERHGRIDILAANAGIYPPATLEDLTEELWDHVLAINTKSLFLAVKACAPQMKQQRYGRIVATSSITGTRVGQVGMSHYSASKAAMNGFMLSAALELAPFGVTINAVEPGNVLTDGIRGLMSQAEIDEMATHIPMKRLADPNEVAYVALFFASDEAAYVTGQGLVLDGGQTLPEFGHLI